MNKEIKEIRIGHSPDPDDAFMYYGFATGQVTIDDYPLVNVLHDIQRLNEMAQSDDPLEVTALSVHAFLELKDRYELLEVGTSVGRNYGPRLVALEDGTLDSFAGKTIALPGPKTTATLAARGLFPEFKEVHVDFDRIIDVVKAKEVDAGLLIHEGQLTYADHGLKLIADLGILFAERHGGLPLPLGVNCVRKDLPEKLKQKCADAYRKSVNIAMQQRVKAIDYSMDFGRGLDKELADRFVGMYVNEDSLHFTEDIRRAIDILENEYFKSR